MRVAYKLRNFTIFLAFLSFLYSISPTSAGNDLKEDYDQLFLFVTIISVIVAVGVIGMWIYFMQRFSESNSKTERTPISHETSRKLELTWTLVAIGIVIILMIVSYPVLFKLDQDTENLIADETIQVNAFEYGWQFVTQNATGHDVFNDRITIQADFNYKFEVTSTTSYIHSFFVPDLNIKVDALPGSVNSITVHIGDPGVYDVVCAEYCGSGHSFMRPGADGVPAGAYEITVIP